MKTFKFVCVILSFGVITSAISADDTTPGARGQTSARVVRMAKKQKKPVTLEDSIKLAKAEYGVTVDVANLQTQKANRHVDSLIQIVDSILALHKKPPNDSTKQQ